jgi:hypothetical protein
MVFRSASLEALKQLLFGRPSASAGSDYRFALRQWPALAHWQEFVVSQNTEPASMSARCSQRAGREISRDNLSVTHCKSIAIELHDDGPVQLLGTFPTD